MNLSMIIHVMAHSIAVSQQHLGGESNDTFPDLTIFK